MKRLIKWLSDEWPMVLMVLFLLVIFPLAIYLIIRGSVIRANIRWYEKRRIFFEPLVERTKWYCKALEQCASSANLSQFLLGRCLAELNGFLLKEEFKLYKQEKKYLEQKSFELMAIKKVFCFVKDNQYLIGKNPIVLDSQRREFNDLVLQLNQRLA